MRTAPKQARRAVPGERVISRGGEAGVVLVLALLVMLLLMVVVSQLFYSSHVDNRLARNRALDLQMEKLATAALLKARAALIQDIEDDLASADAGAGAGAGGGLPGGGEAGQPVGAGTGGGAGGTGSTTAPPSGPHVDSLDEGWASGDVPFDLGEYAELKTRIYIEDEDGKFNFLLLATENEEYRREWRERFIRLLDIMRDGYEGDLTSSDAGDFLDRFETWMRGDRDGLDMPLAPLASGEVTMANNDAFHAPLSLAELTLTGAVDERMMFGYADGEDDDRVWVPGLQQVFTVWSNLAFAAAPPDPNSGPSRINPPPGQGGTGDGELQALGTSNGRINVNTASIVVLRALLPDNEIPVSAWEEYEEFRQEKLDELENEREDWYADFDEDSADAASDDPDGPRYPLETVEDLQKFPSFSEQNSFISTESFGKLRSLLTVESNVFTIHAVIATRREPFRYYCARSVVWRKVEGEKVTIVPIIPFERVPTASIDLHKMRKELEEEKIE